LVSGHFSVTRASKKENGFSTDSVDNIVEEAFFTTQMPLRQLDFCRPEHDLGTHYQAAKSNN
jgi:hypothetical protein